MLIHYKTIVTTSSVVSKAMLFLSYVIIGDVKIMSSSNVCYLFVMYVICIVCYLTKKEERWYLYSLSNHKVTRLKLMAIL